MMKGKYTNQIRDIIKEQLPYCHVVVYYAPEINPKKEEYYMIYIDDFRYSIYEPCLKAVSLEQAIQIIIDLYNNDLNVHRED